MMPAIRVQLVTASQANSVGMNVKITGHTSAVLRSYKIISEHFL